ncbi:MAG: NAD-dependent isocitrate dehydrogenase, partial [Ardenticatenales bacterium]|nr:NAD-dependent isocitrate dehydrogenase [Ardenticatenales bacterium]
MERELVVIAGDDIGREVVPLAVRGLRAVLPDARTIDAEAGYDHAWRTGQSIEQPTLELVQQARSVLMGPEREFPEGVASALLQLTRAFD